MSSFSGEPLEQEKRKVLLGVTGSISAYKSVDLLRRLQKLDFEVRVVASESSLQFVGQLTWEGLTGHPAAVDVLEVGKGMDHIYLPDWADIYAVVPATANTLEGFVSGRSDSMVMAAYLAASCPVLVAPAMNVNMWRHPATRRNIAQLKDDGVFVVEPGEGVLACGWSGEGRLAEPAAIELAIHRLLAPKDLSGKTIYVTAGATREFIDPARFLSNPSTGKMGFALAQEAWFRGANVVLVAPETMTGETLALLRGNEKFEFRPFRNTQSLYEAVQSTLSEKDETWYISAAAISDYTVDFCPSKTKKKEEDLQIELHRTVDILATLGAAKTPQLKLIGFAAETDDILEYARKKCESKNLDAIVHNRIGSGNGSGFASATNEGGVLTADGQNHEIGLMSKEDFASEVLSICGTYLSN